ncbi:MAG TPA: glycoside hydrolase family 88 protein, partial [Candidatus Binatia bacterium]|nr:glycoside hydrolase family 88 protein [Candidatus Binatia bacterium]
MKTIAENLETDRQRSAAVSRGELERAFELCVRKTRGNIKRLADEPKSAAWALDGNYFNFKEGFYEIGNWTSSFFTGMALIAWRETEDEYFLKEVQRLAPDYAEKVFIRHRDTHHDIGFLYSLYSVAIYKLTGDTVHREIALRAAEVLSRRFNASGGFIRAWGHTDTDEHANMAIIDCLMNLPLLYWAAKESRDQKYYDIAVRHADMVLKYFVRPDNSVCHAFRFDLKTGKPIGPDNFCGRSVNSYWARGAAWAIYGFALGYGYTRKEKYLDAALRLARKFISQLDRELVPVWDFRLPPDAEPVRDSSAAVVAVCGIQELARHHAADIELLQVKNALLDRVCSGDYLDFNDQCPGILKSAYGDKPAYSSWGDYFLMEALDR